MPDPENLSSLYVGLISGTSMDGIDAALVRLNDRHCETIATTCCPYPPQLREALITASRKPDETTVDMLGDLDHWVGTCFRDATKALLDSSGTESSLVRAIGSHGQTIRHRPHGERPFTMQIGDPNIIASGTGITTVADFRRRDLAAGGEGAPLTPGFHQWLFADEKQNRVVLNIGGIANVTVLPENGGNVTGFDTGPGNGLMDAWMQKERNVPFDDDGAWASVGKMVPELLSVMLNDPYFALTPPKSTGFEYFNLEWVVKHTSAKSFLAADIQATLLSLTSQSICQAIEHGAPGTQEILLCGGGVHNGALMADLAHRLPSVKWTSTGDYGVDPDWVEAAAFAWMASRTLLNHPGNLPSVTGARRSEVLGGIYACAD